MSSSFTAYKRDENGIDYARKIDNDNNFLDNLKKCFNDRKCMVIISGNPQKRHHGDPTEVTRQSFEMSGIPFDEYIYVNNENKQNIKEYIKKATVINLFGGHLPRCNAFINELNLKKLIRDYNGVIIGASGGAMNMADNVYCMPEEVGEFANKSFNRHLKGLGLTDINIIPHYNFYKDKTLDGARILEDILIPDSYTTPLTILPDRSYIIQQENDVTYYGNCYLLNNGEMQPIRNCENDVNILK